MNVVPRDDKRILWLDSLRGVTVLLVVLHHSFIAASPWLERFGDTQIHWLAQYVNGVLSLMRMPAFFLCSGALFAVTMQRGWGWFVHKRLAFAGWVILLWTLIFYAAAELRLDLFPSRTPPTGTAPWHDFLWFPYYYLWFVYAIAILGAVAMALRPLPPKLQAGAVVLLAAGLWWLDSIVAFPHGLRTLLINLYMRGLLFFLLGVLLSARLRASPPPGPKQALAALTVLLSGAFAAKIGWSETLLSQLVLSFPMTFAAITLLRWILGHWNWLSRKTAALGRQSLEIFILHPIGIAAGFYGLTLLPFAPNWSVVLATITLSGALVSLALAAVLRQAPGNLFFRAPALPQAREPRQVPAE